MRKYYVDKNGRYFILDESSEFKMKIAIGSFRWNYRTNPPTSVYVPPTPEEVDEWLKPKFYHVEGTNYNDWSESEDSGSFELVDWAAQREWGFP